MNISPAGTDAVAITNINPTAFFMFPPRISRKLTILVAAIVVPLAKFLKTKADPAAYEVRMNEIEKSSVPFVHCSGPGRMVEDLRIRARAS